MLRRRGDTVTVTSDDGKLSREKPPFGIAHVGTSRDYRVTTTQRVRKASLSASIYARAGRRRLVLVTCGGPVHSASGHDRDSVVTAPPR